MTADQTVLTRSELPENRTQRSAEPILMTPFCCWSEYLSCYFLVEIYKKRPLPLRAAVLEVYQAIVKVTLYSEENTTTPEALRQRG